MLCSIKLNIFIISERRKRILFIAAKVGKTGRRGMRKPAFPSKPGFCCFSFRWKLVGNEILYIDSDLYKGLEEACNRCIVMFI